MTTEPRGVPAEPLLRIVRGNPGPEEVAALVGVLSALRVPEEAPAPPRSAWSDPARRMRPTLVPAPGGWRASALPR